MSESQVHFEVFVRRNASASWTLELACENRTQATEAAELMLAEKRAIAVKVMKETLDPESGEYRSITLLTKGELAVAKPKARLEEDASPLCTGPGDLYTVHARERIGRLLDTWLARNRVTPFELLHRADLAEALDASGMELRHAIQKIAIPEAQATGATTHEVMRRYQKLAETAIERVIRDGRRRAFPDLSAARSPGEGFAEAVRRLAGTADGPYLVGGAVAAYLKGAAGWAAKIDLILDLADAAPETHKAFAFALLCQPLSEILGSRGGLVDFVGPDQDLGASLALLTRLVAASEIDALARIEPGLEDQFPALTPQIARLAGWLHSDGFAFVRGSLARRILAELNGPRRLRPTDARGEILILRALAMVLTVFAGSVLPAEDVQSAFTERSRALVGSDFVQGYLKGADSSLAEVQALVRLTENVVGGANKRAAVKWLSAALGAPRFERELRAPSDSPAVRLTSLAELQQAINRLGLPESDRIRISGQIGEVGGLIEGDCRLTATLARASAPAAQRLLTLLRLASGETAPIGPAATRAKAEVHRLVRAPEIRAQLAGAPELLERLKEMMQAA